MHSHDPLERAVLDLEAVRGAFALTSPIESEHPYLAARAIPVEVYTGERFAGRVRTDARGNVIFPHWQSSGG